MVALRGPASSSRPRPDPGGPGVAEGALSLTIVIAIVVPILERHLRSLHFLFFSIFRQRRLIDFAFVV